MTEYEKHRLPQATILSKTRYIGFNRQPLTDASRNIVSTEKAQSKYPLMRGGRWIDMERKP